jgi:hypothetical protein
MPMFDEPQLRRPRPRTFVHPALLSVARVAFRHSFTRDAYVLRGVGDRHGPVLKRSFR